MKVVASVFAVSIIAIMSAVPVQAEIVSTELLDKRLGTEGNLAAVAHTGSYNDLANKPTIPTKTSQLTNDSSFATTTAVNAKLATVTQGGTGVVKSVEKNGTDVKVTRGALTADEIPTLTTAKISGLGSLATKSSVASADITNDTIKNEDINANAGIAPTKIAIDTMATYESIPVADKDKHIPSVAVVENIAGATADAAVASAVTNVGNTYQVKSTANYQMGKSGGGWTTMTADQQSALNSKITSGKVTTYDGYAAQIAGKVALAQGSGAAKKVMATNSTGAVVPADITGSGSVKVTVADSGAITVSGTDTKYTLPAATASTLGGVKAGSNVTIAADGTISTHAPVTPGNGTVTIKQGGDTKGSFTLNQTGAATIELTDNNTTYTASGSNGVSASVSGSAISVSGTTATRDAVGVAKLGVIPVGTTGTSTATIWVE